MRQFHSAAQLSQIPNSHLCYEEPKSHGHWNEVCLPLLVCSASQLRLGESSGTQKPHMGEDE
jgi:hypothetical protein